MKENLRSFPRWAATARELLLGLAAAACASASAQNFLKNPDFEEELGPNNWTVVYTGVTNPVGSFWPTTCGPNDFEMKGRSRVAHKDQVPGTWDGEFHGLKHYWSKMGGHFRAGHDWKMHAYFSQVVRGLNVSSNYNVSCWMTKFEGNFSQFQVYLEAVGATSVTGPLVTTSAFNNPTNWTYSVLTTKPNANGEIEARLHYNKNTATANGKWRNCDAFYDHAAVMLAGTQPPPPDFRITSLVLSNQDATLIWDTALNNSYRILVTSSRSDPNSWQTFIGPYPWQDPDFLATGTNFMFTTNVIANSTDNPNYNPDLPLFFRIFSQSYNPKPW